MQKILLFLSTLLFIFACNASSGSENENNHTENDSINLKNKKETISLLKKDTVMPDSVFKRMQLKNKNPQIAYKEKEHVVKQLIEDAGIDYNSIEVFFRTIKEEQILEVWAKDRVKNDEFKLIKTYNLCVNTNPDTLRGTDLLVPESFYYIKHFHPGNPYFVRLEINFPNESDRKRGRSGGDIAIHGGCYSTYCSPFTDDDIKEIYIFAVEAKSKGQKEVPVHNFPFRMTDENTERYKNDPRYKNDRRKIFNRDNMKFGYQYFEKHKQLFEFTVDKEGRYIYEEN